MLTLAAGCGAKAREARPVPPSEPPTPTASSSAAAPSAPALPTLDAIAARQVRVAPGMRELLRGESAGSVPLPKAERDECVRVAFAAAGPVRVALVEQGGAELAASAAVNEGLLDVRGPVCFHASSKPRLEMKGDAGSIRYVVWGAP